MSEEQDRQRGFFSRFFSGEDEDETMVFSEEEIGMEEPDDDPDEKLSSHGFTVERAAEIIKDLPQEVSRESAVRIVRHTLAAAGINLEDLARSANRREAKLNSRIELSQHRSQEMENRTRKVISSLEEEIRKAREARDFGVREEEKKISRARSGLEDVDLVREFFGLPKEAEVQEEQKQQEQQEQQESAGDETQTMQRDEGDETQVIERGPLYDERNRRRRGRDS